MIKKIYITSFLLILTVSAFPQRSPDYLQLVRVESELSTMFDSLYSEEVTGVSFGLYHSIDSLFEYAIGLPGAFEYEWSKLDKIGKLWSDDGIVRVFSWLYMASRNEYHYRAYIQVKKRRDSFEVFKLIPGDDEKITAHDFSQTIDQWHGKIYYGLVTKRFKRKTFYTLIGADFNDIHTSIKTIEVIAIQRGKPVFRDDQFLLGGAVQDRIVLEYSADLAASVRYNKELDMIVYDHLAPLHPIYTGNYQFYGPDGSYDGLTFEEGIWVQTEDVDARNR